MLKPEIDMAMLDFVSKLSTLMKAEIEAERSEDVEETIYCNSKRVQAYEALETLVKAILA